MKEAPTVKKHPQKTLETKKYQTFTHSRKQLAQANQNQTNKDKRNKGKSKSKCTYQAEIWRREVEIHSNVADNKRKNHR